MPNSSRLKNDAALLFVVFVWGINFPIIKIALDVMHPHVVNAFRFVIAAAVLGGLYAYRTRGSGSGFFAPLRTHGWAIAGLGLLGYVLYQLAFIVGINHTTAGNAALIMTAAPLWTALTGRALGFERLGPWAWAGLLVSLAGTTLVVLTGADLGAGSLFGNLTMLAAAVLWGAYTALNKPVVRDVSPLALTFFGLLLALPFLVALAVPYAPGVAWGAAGVWVWAAIVFSGGLSIGLAVALWNAAVKNVGASNTAVYANLVPLVALIGGVVIRGEAVTWMQIGGGALIIGGLVVMRRSRSRRTPAPEKAPSAKAPPPTDAPSAASEQAEARKRQGEAAVPESCSK